MHDADARSQSGPCSRTRPTLAICCDAVTLGAAVAAVLDLLTGALAGMFRLSLEHGVSLAHAALAAANRATGTSWARVAVSALCSLQVPPCSHPECLAQYPP